MIDNGKNKGEFDDSAFDDDFSDADFEEASFDEAEYADLSDDEAGYEGDDFEAEEDWGDGEEDPSAGKKSKPKKEKSSGGLGFNAIVIIGAIVLGGGVLVFNVMRETNKAETAQPSMFQSILNIGGVMDGTLFGNDGEAAATDTAQTENQGFLNDPATPIPTAEENAAGNPQQPAPNAQADGMAAQNEPLTPMPAPSAEAPRGPEDVPPTENTLATDNTPSAASAVPAQGLVAADAPAPEAAASAEDILKQAMANREQKQTEEPVSSTEVPPSPADKEALEADLEKKMAEAKKKAEEIEQAAKDKVEEVVASVPVPATIEPVVPAQPQTAIEQPAAPVEAIVPEETKQEISANKEAVSALEGKLDTVLSRMDKIENDLNTVRESKGGNTQDLEKTVSSLKEEIAELRSRPAASVASDVSDEPVTPKPSKKKRTVKAVSPEDDAYSPNKPVASIAPSKPAAKSASTNGRWELRAAQPGRAWVSKAGERDMQAVSVGDTLPGIGRIGAITYMNGRWTVSGAQGSIQQ